MELRGLPPVPALAPAGPAQYLVRRPALLALAAGAGGLVAAYSVVHAVRARTWRSRLAWTALAVLTSAETGGMLWWAAAYQSETRE